jgi:hypothetical protein
MTSSSAHVEMIYSDEGVKLIEIGARIGGYRPRMYDVSYGVDLLQAEVALATGQKPDLEGTFRAYSAVYEIFPNAIGSFVGLEGVSNIDDYTYFSVKAKPEQIVGPAKDGYKACAAVIVSSSDAATFERLRATVDHISVKLA